MKYLLLIGAIWNFHWTVDNYYMRSDLVYNGKLHLTYVNDSSDTIQFVNKIYKFEGKKFIIFDSLKLFLDFDQAPQFIGNIDTIVLKYFIPPKEIPIYQPRFTLSFIIDEHGNILDHGINNFYAFDEFQKEGFRLSKLINGKFKPAIINGKPVAAICDYVIDLGILDDKRLK
jgi:hypothetical protein